MENKKDCNIVQDLLPNYLEGLTSQDTNAFIEEHLKTCNGCTKILENMKTESKIEEKAESQEVNYIKKYNKKLNGLKFIVTIFLFIFLAFLVVVASKFLTLQSLSSKMAQTQNLNNYYIKMEYRNLLPKSFESNGNNFLDYDSIAETYYKNGNFVSNSFSADSPENVSTYYKNGTETFWFINRENRKSLIYANFLQPLPQCHKPNGIFQNLYLATFADVRVETFAFKTYYVLHQDGIQCYYDFETGLLLKEIVGINSSADYYYEFGNVTDDDIARPDTTGAVEGTISDD